MKHTPRYLRRPNRYHALLSNHTAKGAAIAILTVCGALLLFIGGRGLWRWAAETRATRKTEEAVHALYAQMQDQQPPETPAPPPTQAPAETEQPSAATSAPAVIYHIADGQVRPALTALLAANSDLTGWLTIPGIIEQPVLYRNNTYYETHNFYGQESASGALFLDQNHRLDAGTQNLLIHGHNMKDGTMFGKLLRYQTDINFLRNHGIVRFDTLYEEGAYAIFAVLNASLDPKNANYFDYYTHATFRDTADFEAYISAAQARSLYYIPIDVMPDDALITLSTCLDENRLVILARRIRANESESALSVQVAKARRIS